MQVRDPQDILESGKSQECEMSHRTSTIQNTLVQATIFKKCDRTYHKPAATRDAPAGPASTCEPGQVAACAHKWTVRYSVSSRQREQSFGTLTDAQTFQLTLSTGKQTQGAMFTDPRAGIVAFLPLCDAYVEGMAKANANSKATYRSHFANSAATATTTAAPSAASSPAPWTNASEGASSPGTPCPGIAGRPARTAGNSSHSSTARPATSATSQCPT